MPLERRGGETALPTAQEKIAKAAEAALAYV
jgi:hypothetical protein